MVCGVRAVIAQRDVDQKTNEITQVVPLLAEVDISGALVTADAMHVQRETARHLVEDKGADYLFTAVKDFWGSSAGHGCDVLLNGSRRDPRSAWPKDPCAAAIGPDGGRDLSHEVVGPKGDGEIFAGVDTY
jgi:hypothetical protein